MSGRRRTPRTTLKIAALAPIPSARVRTTVMASPLTLAKDRNANWRSVMMLMPSLRGARRGGPRSCAPALSRLPDARLRALPFRRMRRGRIDRSIQLFWGVAASRCPSKTSRPRSQSPGGWPAACPSCWFPPSLSCSRLGLRHGLEVPFERLAAFCPPFRDQFQIAASHLELLGLQRPTAFPALPHASDQARVGEHEQMLGGGLARRPPP